MDAGTPAVRLPHARLARSAAIGAAAVLVLTLAPPAQAVSASGGHRLTIEVLSSRRRPRPWP